MNGKNTIKYFFCVWGSNKADPNILMKKKTQDNPNNYEAQ